MVAIRIILDKRRADNNGNYPTKIIITNNQTNAAISLNCSLPQKAWLGDGLERPVKSSHPGAKDQIQSFYIEIRKKISDLELSEWNKHVKVADIKKRIQSDCSVDATKKILYLSLTNLLANAKKNEEKDKYLYSKKTERIYPKR